MKRARGWVFTLNNYTDEDETRLTGPPPDHKYVIWGYETAATGTPHLQGAVWFKSVKSAQQVKAYVGERAHVEIVRGTPTQAIDYCKKEGHYFEIGQAPQDPSAQGQKEKQRWADALSLARSGDMDGLAEQHPDIFWRYYNTAKRIRLDSLPAPKPLDVLDNYWYYGETGTGKSRRARDENPGYYLKNINKWWDGYVDQPCVIIEEWSPSVVLGLQQKLKEWADHHPFSAEVKGGTTVLRPPKIIVTSNYRIDECFLDPAILQPLKRRFKIVNFPFRV